LWWLASAAGVVVAISTGVAIDWSIAVVVAGVAVAVDRSTAVALVVVVAVNLSTASCWSTSAADGSSFAVAVKARRVGSVDGSAVAVEWLTVAVTVGSVTVALMGERGDGILASTVWVGNSPLGKIVSSLLFGVVVVADRSIAVGNVVAVDRSTASSCPMSDGFEWSEP